MTYFIFKMRTSSLVNILLFVVAVYGITQAHGRRCNEVLCASVVSKCMLTQACKCDISRDPEKCTCCVDCAKCLGRFYQRCCTCLDMCDEKVIELDPNDSQVGDIKSHFIELFEAIVKDLVIENLNVQTFPADWNYDALKAKMSRKDIPNAIDLGNNRVQVNCSVAYMSQCYSAAKCREECDKIGSGAYRYFFDGCCECIGPTCPSYGINESRCRECSNIGDDLYDYVDDQPMINDPIVSNKVDGDL